MELLKRAGLGYLGNVALWALVSLGAWALGRAIGARAEGRRISRDAATTSESRQAVISTLTLFLDDAFGTLHPAYRERFLRGPDARRPASEPASAA